MNTLEVDTLLKKHPHSRSVFKGAYARNRLPRLLNVPLALMENTDHRMGQHCVAIYIDANSKGENYYPTGRPPFLRDYVNFTKKHCHTWTYNTVRVQEEGSTVCGHHFIFYLIHRCAGHSLCLTEDRWIRTASGDVFTVQTLLHSSIELLSHVLFVDSFVDVGEHVDL